MSCIPQKSRKHVEILDRLFNDDQKPRTMRAWNSYISEKSGLPPEEVRAMDKEVKLKAVLQNYDEVKSGLEPIFNDEETMVEILTKGKKVNQKKKEEEREAIVPKSEDYGDFVVHWKPVKEVLGVDNTNLKLPVFEWKGDKPDNIPEIDNGYKFREDVVDGVVASIMLDEIPYLHGHTGTGKTSLIEQIAARTNAPFTRINFDSSISRIELVGRDVLKVEDGVTISKFVDGTIPRYLSQPGYLVFDEIDFCRPDVAYIMQSVLEGGKFVVQEDGGRVVKPHQMTRLVATGNTAGNGDETGIYTGARVQSAALMDRFGAMIKVPFLSRDDVLYVLGQERLANYYTIHNENFETGTISYPVTLRSLKSIKKLTDLGFSFKQAVEVTIRNRFPKNDHKLLDEIVRRA